MLDHMVSTWRRLLFTSGFWWNTLLLDEENRLNSQLKVALSSAPPPCFSLTVPVSGCFHIHGRYRGALQKPTLPSLLSPLHATWARVPEEGQGRAGWISPTASGHKANNSPYGLQGRSPKWGSSLCSCRGCCICPETFCFRASLDKATVTTQSPVTWIQFSNCQIISTQLIINLKVAIIFAISLITHPRFTEVKPWRWILFYCSNNQSEEKLDIITVTHRTNICSTAKCNSCYINALAVLQLRNTTAKKMKNDPSKENTNQLALSSK